jgi:CheY-like chemotaxis protein
MASGAQGGRASRALTNRHDPVRLEPDPSPETARNRDRYHDGTAPASGVNAPARAERARDRAETVKRVLLVEDDPQAREIYGEILEYAGFAVSLAVDGEEALDLARSEVPALILMDIHLPLLSGWDALEALKDDPRTRDIPVVAITANGGPDSLERAANSDFESYHVKPVSPGKLLAEVQRLIGEPSENIAP